MEAAETFLKKALAGMEEHLGESHNYTNKIYQDLDELLLQMGKNQEALGQPEKAASGLEASRGQDSVVMTAARERLGTVRDVIGEEEQLSS